MDLSNVVPLQYVSRAYCTSSNCRNDTPADQAEEPAHRTDSVEISSAGQALAAQNTASCIPSLFLGINTSNGISLNDFTGSLSEKTAALKSGLDQAFAAAGIDNTAETSLSVGYDGSILAGSDSPDKARIEKLFQDNPELANRFREVSAMSSLLRAGREAVEFQKAYAQDPVAAVQNYNYLFNGNYRAEFHLSYSSDSVSVYFTDLVHNGRQYLDLGPTANGNS